MSIETFLLAHESAIRLGFMLGTFVLMALWEIAAPLRMSESSKTILWPNHLALAATNVVLSRVLFPMAAVALGMFAGKPGVGLFIFLRCPTPWLYRVPVSPSIWPSTFSTWHYTQYRCSGACTGCTTPISTSM